MQDEDKRTDAQNEDDEVKACYRLTRYWLVRRGVRGHDRLDDMMSIAMSYAWEASVNKGLPLRHCIFNSVMRVCSRPRDFGEPPRKQWLDVLPRPHAQPRNRPCGQVYQLDPYRDSSGTDGNGDPDTAKRDMLVVGKDELALVKDHAPAVCFKMDFEAWYYSLSLYYREILDCLRAGFRRPEIREAMGGWISLEELKSAIDYLRASVPLELLVRPCKPSRGV